MDKKLKFNLMNSRNNFSKCNNQNIDFSECNEKMNNEWM